MSELLSLEEQKARRHAAIEVVKSLAGEVPILGLFLVPHDAYEAYQKIKQEAYIQQLLQNLDERVQDLRELFSDSWLRTKEGQLYARKVIDCAIDAQLEDKHQLFASALINGIQNKEITDLEKLKFVDMLRQLSLVSLRVLSELHKIYGDRVHWASQPRTINAAPQISVDNVIQQLQGKFHPFLIEASIAEMKAIGLFSRFSAWRYGGDNSFKADGHISDSAIYSEFTARFIEFITSFKKN